MFKVAAIIPTRKRLPRLLKTLDSIMSTATDKDCIEAVLRVDEDDFETLTGFPSQNYPWVKIVKGPRYTGYTSMGKFVTEACAATDATWCLLIDDDSWLIGKGWDEKLRNIPTTGFLAQAMIYNLGHSTYFYPESSPVGLFFPNQCWKLTGQEELSSPADIMIYDAMIKTMGWKMRYIEGLTYRHDRDSDEVMALRD